MTNTPTVTTIADATETAATDLFELDPDTLDGNVYRQFVDELEEPLLTAVMKWARGNQSKAARRLGMNRATLRSKLKRHGLL